MIKVVRKVVMVAILMVCTVESFAKTNGKESSFDWTPVMNAIIQVESGGTQGCQRSFLWCDADHPYLCEGMQQHPGEEKE